MPNAWTVTLDVAAVLGALVWPIVLGAVLIAYRSHIPAAVSSLAGRVQKVEFAGVVAIDLAMAKPFVPNWSDAAGGLDLRQQARAVQINDSTARNFLTQLTERGSGDYAEINLGAGTEWLCSRLYIMSILFSRMKAIDCFVFLETAGTVRRHFVGWADPDKLRWALARQYPWLEQAYAAAWSATAGRPDMTIVNRHGRFASTGAPDQPDLAINLLQAFLQAVQMNGPNAPDEDWVLIDGASSTWERASWIDAERLETLLGEALETRAFQARELASSAGAAAVLARLAPNWQFIALVSPEHRLEGVLHGERVVAALAGAVAAQSSRVA